MSAVAVVATWLGAANLAAAAPPQAERPTTTQTQTQTQTQAAVDAEAPAKPLGPHDPRPIEWRLGGADPVVVGLSASYWVRGEVRDEPHDGESRSDWQVLQRARLGSRLRYRALTVNVEVQDVRRWGSESGLRATDPSLGLGRTYLEVAGARGKADGFVRVGRQSLSYGSERMIGAANWNPHTQLLDGVRAHGSYGIVGLDVAAVLTTMPTRFDSDRGTVQTYGDWLGIAELSLRPHPGFGVEAYLLTHDQGPSETAPGIHRTVLSPGARISGEPITGLRYELEGYVQSGRWDGRPHVAWAGAATVRAETKLGSAKLAALASYMLASGSACERQPEAGTCSDGVHRDFFPFFGSRHRYLGYADLFGFSNVRDLQLGPELAVGKWMNRRSKNDLAEGPAAKRPSREAGGVVLNAQLHYHLLQLHEAGGTWTRANGSLVGVGWDADNHRHTVGHEIDLRLRFTPWWPLTIEPGYALFIPDGAGPALLGSAAPVHFGYLLLSAGF